MSKEDQRTRNEKIEMQKAKRSKHEQLGAMIKQGE